jgi:phosphoribosylformylglycinamidine (FGAM) synthase-like enzyme
MLLIAHVHVFAAHCGEAMAMGERSPVALVAPAAAARMAVGEAVMNIAAADIDDIAVCMDDAIGAVACLVQGRSQYALCTRMLGN